MLLPSTPPESETERLLLEALDKLGPTTVVVESEDNRGESGPRLLKDAQIEKVPRVLRAEGPGVVLVYCCTAGGVCLFHWNFLRDGVDLQYNPSSAKEPWPPELPVELRCEVLARCLLAALDQADIRQRRPLPAVRKDGGILWST